MGSYSIAQETIFNIPLINNGEEYEKGYIYNGVILLYTRNQHNTVNQLQLNFKKCLLWRKMFNFDEALFINVFFFEFAFGRVNIKELLKCKEIKPVNPKGNQP